MFMLHGFHQSANKRRENKAKERPLGKIEGGGVNESICVRLDCDVFGNHGRLSSFGGMLLYREGEKMKEKKALGFNLKRFRQFKGLSQEDLAKKVGLTKDTISKVELEKQENIGLKYLSLICRELDISIEELFVEDANYIPLKIVVSDKTVETLKNITTEFIRALAKKEE